MHRHSAAELDLQPDIHILKPHQYNQCADRVSHARQQNFSTHCEYLTREKQPIKEVLTNLQ